MCCHCSCSLVWQGILQNYSSLGKILLGTYLESKIKEQDRAERDRALSCFVCLQNFLDSAWSLVLFLFIWVETH